MDFEIGSVNLKSFSITRILTKDSTELNVSSVYISVGVKANSASRTSIVNKKNYLFFAVLKNIFAMVSWEHRYGWWKLFFLICISQNKTNDKFDSKYVKGKLYDEY